MPMKNLRLINGKPLIAYAIEAAKASNVFDEIYVNSEAEIFREIAEDLGVKFFKRDERFSSDATVNDEFLLDFVEKTECDYCIQLLPTSPLIEPETIAAFVNGMLEGTFDTYVSVTRHQIACIFGEEALNFKTDERHRSSQEMEPVYSYATVLMSWQTQSFKESMETFGCGYHGGKGKVGYFEIDGLAEIDIDEESDFQLAEVAVKARIANASAKVEPSYYESRRNQRDEFDVPAILKRDGVINNDFGHENIPVTYVDEAIAEADSSISWSRRVINTESNSATIISQLPGEGNRLHYHPDWNEWWYILRGKWKWNIGEKEVVIEPGQIVFMPKNVWHKITAIGDEPAVRLAVSRSDVIHTYEENDGEASANS